MEPRKRALVGECISRASVDAARGAPITELHDAVSACDYERAATIAMGRARAGTPVSTQDIARILPGIELPAITCSLIAIAPSKKELADVLDAQRFPRTKDAAELEVITLYAAWKAGAETARLIPHLRRLSARSLSAESYALLATIAATIDDPNVVAATKPIAPFAKEYAKNVAADDKAMHASLDAVYAELPTEVIASLASGFTVRASGPQVGRNDPCPCGSGNKYKKCCADKPQAAPSPIPGLSFDEFLAGDKVTGQHVSELSLRDAARLDITKLADTPLAALMNKFVTHREWEHAHRVQAEAATRDTVRCREMADELAHYLVSSHRLDQARPLIATLPPDRKRAFELELAFTEGPEVAFRTLVAHARDVVAAPNGGEPDFPELEFAYSLLRAEPALGIIAARACIGTMNVDDAEILLETVEEARDQLNLPPADPAWDVLDTISAQTAKGKRAEKPDASLVESSAKIAELERKLEATKAQLQEAKTRPAAELMRSMPTASAIEIKVHELEARIREGNAERRELRKKIEEHEVAAKSERDDSPRARRATLDEPDEGFDDSELVAGQRDVTLPRFERRFVDAIAAVPTQVASETMRTIGTLAAGDGFAWRSVKQAKDMARQVLMARVGIHHRLIFRVEDDAFVALDLITREQLDTTLKRLRMNR
jgi:hypothetical protein